MSDRKVSELGINLLVCLNKNILGEGDIPPLNGGELQNGLEKLVSGIQPHSIVNRKMCGDVA